MADHTIPTPGTPLPWHKAWWSDNEAMVHAPKPGGIVHVSGPAGNKDAAYIVTACNLFPELFEYVASSAMNGCATAQALVAKAGA